MASMTHSRNDQLRSALQTIQVALDKKLLTAANLAAKRNHVSRSALIREALERHLRHLKELELDYRDRRASLFH